MESNESWWRKSADVAENPQSASQPEARPRAEEPVDFESEVEGDSIGGQIDRAIGDFDARILRLKQELQEKQTDIKELEIRIADLEKEQAKAFKKLLSANPQIKRMLGAKPKSRPSIKRKKTTEPQADEHDTESLL